MGQSATLYRLNQDSFSAIMEDPEGTDIFSITKEYLTFQKTHEGFVFLLSKNQNEQTAKLARQIFYPETSNKKSDDFDKINSGILPDGFDFDSFYKLMENILYYNKPEVVTEISNYLNNITEADFRNLFDYKELNREGIYPYDIWNDEVREDIAFNAEHMIKEFRQLKDFYHAASNERDYVLSFVG